MRLEGELFEVKRGMFYACLACVEGYKGSDGFIVVPMVRSNLREEGFSANSGWVIEKGLFNSVDPNFLIFGKTHQLPVYRVRSDRKLSLKSRGRDWILTVGIRLGCLCIPEIKSVGEFLVV